MWRLQAISNKLNKIIVVDSYQAFNDPGIIITEEITELTGITKDMVEGHSIDWDHVHNVLTGTDIIVCHNAEFDGGFLRAANPELFNNMIFACTKKGINWKAKNILNNKLDYINWKLGYFYDGHRAINDCWATLNILVNVPDAIAELINVVQGEQHDNNNRLNNYFRHWAHYIYRGVKRIRSYISKNYNARN